MPEPFVCTLAKLFHPDCSRSVVIISVVRNHISSDRPCEPRSRAARHPLPIAFLTQPTIAIRILPPVALPRMLLMIAPTPMSLSNQPQNLPPRTPATELFAGPRRMSFNRFPPRLPPTAPHTRIDVPPRGRSRSCTRSRKPESHVGASTGGRSGRRFRNRQPSLSPSTCRPRARKIGHLSPLHRSGSVAPREAYFCSSSSTYDTSYLSLPSTCTG